MGRLITTCICIVLAPVALSLFPTPVRAAVQTFPIALGDTVAPDVPAAGAGRIEGFDAQDEYAFTGGAGERVFIDLLQIDGECSSLGPQLQWILVGPSRQFVGQGLLQSCMYDLMFELPEAGTYIFTVAPTTGSAVTYSFKLGRVVPGQTYPITIGDTVAPDVPGAGAGRVERPDDPDIYTFIGAAGQRVYFKALEVNGDCSTSNGVQWELRRPNGEVEAFGFIFDCFDARLFVLPDSGTYMLVVASTGSPATYSFKLSAVPAPEVFDVAIGDTVAPGMPSPGAGEIETPGAEDVYAFSGVAGQRLFLDVLDVPGGCSAPFGFLQWTLERPDGEQDWSGRLQSCELDDLPIVLQADGRHRLIVAAEPDTLSSGTYSFELRALPPEPPPPQAFDITFGQTIAPDVPGPGAGRIETFESKDVYRFTASAPQRILFEVLELDGTCDFHNSSLDWELTGPNGDSLLSTSFQTCFEEPLQLREAGTYTLTVKTHLTPGTYSFRLAPLRDPERFDIQIGATVGPDGSGAGSIESRYDQDVYSFSSTAGKRVVLDVLDVGGSCAGDPGPLVLELRLPDGHLQGEFPLSSCSSDAVIELPFEGVYSATVEAKADGRPSPDTGTYRFSLTAVAAPQTFRVPRDGRVGPGVPSAGAGAIETPGAVDIYRFTATHRRAFLDVLDLEGGCTSPRVRIEWTLHRGAEFFTFDNMWSCGADQQIELPSLGSYTLTVSGPTAGSMTAAYALRLTPIPPPDVASIAVGEPVVPGSAGSGTGSIETPGAEDVYTFSALAGERIFVDVQDVAGACGDPEALEWQLTGPPDADGIPFFAGGPFNCDSKTHGAITLDQAGSYTLTVRGGFNDPATGDYRFKLLPAPLASFTATPDNPLIGQPVTFDASGSRDLRGSIVKYEWDTDEDGTFESASAGATLSRAYQTWGPRFAYLRVTNDAGGTDVTYRGIFARDQPSVAAAALPPPQLAQTANLARIEGDVLVKRPGAGRFERVTKATQIPVGSIVDTTTGRAQLTTATETRGRTQSGSFAAGLFRFKQQRSALAELDLVGGDFRACASGKSGRKAETARRKRRKRRTVRKLWSDAGGQFRTDGRNSSTSVRGTVWLTADRCDGTLTRVVKGTVTVRDFARKRTVSVRRGQSYLARPAGAARKQPARRRR